MTSINNVAANLQSYQSQLQTKTLDTIKLNGAGGDRFSQAQDVLKSLKDGTVSLTNNEDGTVTFTNAEGESRTVDSAELKDKASAKIAQLKQGLFAQYGSFSSPGLTSGFAFDQLI